MLPSAGSSVGMSERGQSELELLLQDWHSHLMFFLFLFFLFFFFFLTGSDISKEMSKAGIASLG